MLLRKKKHKTKFIQDFLSENIINSYSAKNGINYFEYIKHMPELNELPGNKIFDKIIFSLELGFILLEKWSSDISKSTYPFQWYACLQVESSWLYQIPYAPPPYLVLNSKTPVEIKSYITKVEKEFPLKVPYWSGKQYSLFSRYYSIPDDDESTAPYINYVIIWRIHL